MRVTRGSSGLGPLRVRVGDLHRAQLEERERAARLADAPLLEEDRTAVEPDGERADGHERSGRDHGQKRDDDVHRALGCRRDRPELRVHDVLEPGRVDLGDGDVAEDLLVERGQLPQPERQVEAVGGDLLEDAEAGGLARQDEQVDAARLDHLGQTAERAERRHLAVHARRAVGQGDPPHDRVARDAHQRQLAGHVRGGPVRADDRRAERPLTPPADAGQVGGDRRRGRRERPR